MTIIKTTTIALAAASLGLVALTAQPALAGGGHGKHGGGHGWKGGHGHHGHHHHHGHHRHFHGGYYPSYGYAYQNPCIKYGPYGPVNVCY